MTYLKRAIAHRDPRYAEILRRLGHAEEVATPQAKEEPKAEKAKKQVKRRSYKRRDMQAEEE